MSPDPSGRSKRRNDPQALRGRILDATALLFFRQGYASTSMHDVMDKAGVTSGALHHHFATKKVLGVAVIRERIQAAVEQAWIDPVQGASSTADGVRDALSQIIAIIDDRASVIGCALNNLAVELAFADIDFRAELAPIFAAWRQSLIDRLVLDTNQGRVFAATPDALATLIVAAYSGAMAQAKVEQTSRALRTVADQLVDMLGGEPA